jgi:hypothetical protein
MKHYAMKAYGGVDVWIHIFLTSALAGGEWSISRPGRFTPRVRASGTHLIRGSVGPRAVLDHEEKRKFFTLLGLELRPLGRPASSQSLYRLRYPSFYYNMGLKQKKNWMFYCGPDFRGPWYCPVTGFCGDGNEYSHII